MGLIDVMMAIAILLLVLIPAALLVSSANASSGNSEHRLAAIGVASSYLDEVQALQGPTAPGGALAPFASAVEPYDSYFGPCVGLSACVGWPTATANSDPFSTKQVGSITYSITAAGGWCEEMNSGNGTTWVQPTSGGTPVTVSLPPGSSQTSANVYGYWVAVKVTWGAGGRQTGYVVQDAMLSGQAPTGAATVAGWPTLSILQQGLSAATPMCPTGLR